MLKAILQMYCHPSGEDKFIWTPDPKGLFSTRSAFQLTMRSNNFSILFSILICGRNSGAFLYRIV